MARVKAAPAAAPGSANVADIVCVVGASGSGKSTYIKRRLAAEKPGRLVVWDAMAEYPMVAAESLSRLWHVMQHDRFAVRYVPKGDQAAQVRQFDAVCRMCFVAGGVFLVAEELADVTKPSWAPEWWSKLTRQGRHRGARIIGASQRPAGIDKTFFGNASTVRTGRLNYRPDIAVVSGVLGVEVGAVAGLLPLEWIERNMGSGALERGKITF